MLLGKTTFEKGWNEGCRSILRLQLEAKFGKLSKPANLHLEAKSGESLLELGVHLLDAKSQTELGLETAPRSAVIGG